MIYEHCSSLTFLPDEFLYRLYMYHSNIRFTSWFHRVFIDMFENKSKPVNILILLFYIVLSFLGPSRYSDFIRFATLSWTQDTSFYILHRFYILNRQLIRISYSPF